MKRGVVVLRADHGWSSWGPELVAMSPDLVANVRTGRGASHHRGISNLDGLTLCGTYPGSVQHGEGSHRFGCWYRLSTNTRKTAAAKRA